MTDYTISGQGRLPGGDAPLLGKWEIRVVSSNGVAFDSGGNFRAGTSIYKTDASGNVLDYDGSTNVDLPQTTADYLYEARFSSLDLSGPTARPISLGPFVFELTSNITWQDIIETPTILPTTPANVDLVQSLADQVADDKDQVATDRAAVEAVGTTNDTVIKGRIDNPTSQTRASLNAAFVATISPLDAAYGAVGDNTADDKAALTAAFTAGASFGLTVDLRGKTYKTTDVVTVPAGVTVQNGFIRCAGTGKKIVTITGSNVTLRNMSITGRHGTATASSGEYAIFAEGASAASPLRNLTLENVAIELVGQYGVWLKWVDGFRISGCDFGDLGYCGVLTYSGLNGVIDGCRIDNVLAGFSSNGYGIAMSRDETDSLATDPRSSRILVVNNLVNNVPWAGIDTHGGSQIVIRGNSVRNCKTAIALGESDNASNVTTWASQDCTVDGNTIDSTVTNGSYPYAINITGVLGAGIGSPGELSAGCRVTNNVIRGHGLEASTIGCSIIARDTKGLVVSGNTIIEPGRTGILFYYDNYGYTCVGNTTIDPWSNTVGVGEALGVDSNHNGYNTGICTGNVTVRGTKSATYVATYSVASYTTTGSASIALSGNYGGVTSTVRGGAQGVAPLDISSTPFTTSGLATLGSAMIGVSAQKAVTIFSTTTTTGVAASQLCLLAAQGGYGAGVTFQSKEVAGGTVQPQASIEAEGSGNWSNTANASSFMRFSTSIAGTLTEIMRVTNTSLQMADAMNIVVGSTTGTKIGTATTQKLAFYNSTPVVKPSALTAVNAGTLNTGDATSDTIIGNMRTRIGDLESRLQSLGLIA